MKNLFDIKIEVPWQIKALCCSLAFFVGGSMLWPIYVRFDAHFVRKFEEEGGQPRLTLTSADNDTWLLNYETQKLATLTMESPHAGTYDFKIIRSQDPRLEVGTTFTIQKPSPVNRLFCQNCEQITHSRLPLLWRVGD